MNNSDKKSIPKSVVQFFGRYHLTLFIVFLVGGLSTAVLVLNAVLIESANTDGYTSSLDMTTFDQATIDNVKKLRLSSDTPAEFTLPDGRISPFAE